jgi:hypothetical protein
MALAMVWMLQADGVGMEGRIYYTNFAKLVDDPSLVARLTLDF